MKPFVACLSVSVLMAGIAACSHTPARTDAQVAAEVQGTLGRDARIDGREITVQSDQGMVTLTGSVATDDERVAAARDAASVEGVRTVINNLVAQPPRVAQAPAPEQAQPVSAPSPATTRKSKSSPTVADNVAYGGLPKASSNLSNDSASSQPAPTPVVAATPAPPASLPRKVTIPAGTQVNVRLSDGLDTEKNQVGDQFHAALGAPIVIDDETVIPAGADIVGRVVDVKSAGRFAGNSALTLELNSLSVNGKSYNIQSSQWSRQGKGEGKNTAIKAGGGAAVGAIIGGLAGGGKGAAIGSVAGAGAGTGVAATKKGEQIKLAPESSISFLLINPLTVTPQGSNSRDAGRTPLQ